MSGQPEQKKPEAKGRLHVENLPLPEKELTGDEARQIRGNGKLGEDETNPIPIGGRGGMGGDIPR